MDVGAAVIAFVTIGLQSAKVLHNVVVDIRDEP